MACLLLKGSALLAQALLDARLRVGRGHGLCNSLLNSYADCWLQLLLQLPLPLQRNLPAMHLSVCEPGLYSRSRNRMVTCAAAPASLPQSRAS